MTKQKGALKYRSDDVSLPELTRDEQYLRSYVLATQQTTSSAVLQESAFFIPALIIAGISLTEGAEDAIWVAFIYLFGVYLWRVGSGRWGRAMRSLIKKYEARIAELEVHATKA